MNGMRVTAAAIALVAGIVSGIAAFTSWWTFTGTYLGVNGTISFLPGSSYSASVNGATESFAYSSQSIGQVGALYESILALMLVAMVLAFIAGIIGVVSAVGKMKGGGFEALTIAVIVLSGAAVLLGPLAQPYAFAQSSGGGCSGLASGTASPCNSFWGSMSVNGATASWGSDIGFYLAIAVAVLALVAMFVWPSSRTEPSGTASPAGAVPVPTGVPSGKVCLRCGAYYAEPVPAFCSKCGGPVGAIGAQAGFPPSPPP